MGDSGDPFMRNPNAAVQARPKTQNRASVLQLKLMGQSHPTGLTNNLLRLFEPRPPLEYKPPPEKRKCPPYTGMAQFVSKFANPGDPEYAPPKPEVELPSQKRERIHKLRLEKGVEKAAEDLKKYDPNNDPNATGDPYKTLFVSRLNYESSESKIKREFESYGPIKQVHLVADQLTNKPKGYAFIEYMHTRDMKAAYKQADGQKIDGRRVLVDVERGRTVPNWRPRRLGGGLGTSRVGGGEEVVGEQQPQGRISQSEEPSKPREEREKSREKGKERERERSRELSHEQPRERSRDRPREDKHHRDRDQGGRESRRDRDRTRDRGDRDRRDRDRGRDRSSRDHDRERSRKRDRDYEGGEYEHEGGGRSRERDTEYDRDKRGEPKETRGYYEDDQGDTDRYSNRYDKMEEDDYRYEREYKRSERSESREYAR
ncbi:PREDICTED: U1 small nuclear ribonucleoprotein 70 kDa-like [Camelina sativa]|uniref:U1 small nuclear ribonucleoprotein 70 kDa-like n=1 Tax=Camelina sativa TaxID=90675 RepID=A0ABM0YNT0_CAMSA|nr:PREDICTED: U1 small nuclear ribonucleoprotein 70 kDa-like [Camelina sativa]